MTSVLPLPWFSVLPFGLLLVSIAALPLLVPGFWERNRNKGLVAVGMALPLLVWLGATDRQALLHTAREYASFICLLASLFVVAGGVHVDGDLQATPRTNVILLGIGAVLASVIGTTGASMALIRLVLRTNSQRRVRTHVPFFFILVVSNAGGLLTPLGDPPLFLGYLRGVPFFWTLRLLPIWLVCVGYLLALLYWVDRRAYARERIEDRVLDRQAQAKIRVTGRLNIVLLLGIVLSVFLPTPARELSMIFLALVSMGPRSHVARSRNEFSFGPIVEVAVLFAGIFVTMVPALGLLRARSAELHLVSSWQYFLATGMLSSVLDNAPTYLVFLSAAQGLGLTPEVVGIPALHLVAISSGAVLMGANTYIGNGPNFMVKAIAEASGYRTYDFVRYAGWALLTLLPVYLLIVGVLACW